MTIGRLRAALLGGAATLACASWSQVKYTVQELGTAASGSRLSSDGRAVWYPDSKGYYWDRSTGVTQISGPVGSREPRDVNSQGVVVGRHETRDGDRAFIWDKISGYRDLADFGGNENGPYYSWANGVSDNGLVTGLYAGVKNNEDYQRAFVSDFSGNWHTLQGRFEDSYTDGYKINNQGVVAGFEQAKELGTRPRAVIWKSNGTLVDMGLPNVEGSLDARNSDINESSMVCGIYEGEQFINGYTWTESGGYETIVNPSRPWDVTLAFGINDSGQVAGYMGTATGRTAFLYSKLTGAVAINSLLDSSVTGWDLSSASSISNDGSIVGQGYHNGAFVTYVATPVVPEPSTLLLGVGLVGLGLWRRR